MPDSTNQDYLVRLKKLKTAYAELPWYKRWGFSLCSPRLAYAFFKLNAANPTDEQVNTLIKRSYKAWFFGSIFGLLTSFRSFHRITPRVPQGPLLKLPEELVDSTLSNQCSTTDLIALIQSSKTHAALFQPILTVRQFLHHVTRGDYEAVVSMLQKDPSLLTQRGLVTDCSKRTFANISGFEYALWALDKHMWTKMLKTLTLDDTLKSALIEQYHGMEEKGISYQLEGQTIQEKHFNFDPLIDALSIQETLSSGPNPELALMDRQWIAGVGGAQRLLPIHVIFEYCGTTAFYPLPDFTDQPTKKQFYNWLTEHHEDWSHQSWGRLGVDFAIDRAEMWCGAWNAWAVRGRPRTDLNAIEALRKTRINDFNTLKTQLDAPHQDQDKSRGSTSTFQRIP